MIFKQSISVGHPTVLSSKYGISTGISRTAAIARICSIVQNVSASSCSVVRSGWLSDAIITL